MTTYPTMILSVTVCSQGTLQRLKRRV